MKEGYEKLKKEHDELQLECAQLQHDNVKRVREMKEMEIQLKHATFDEDSFRNDDEKVRFFTGLTNWDILSKLFHFVTPYLVGHQSLTPFQQLMLTLMRLRLASSGIELGYQFSIHPSTVFRIFFKCYRDVICTFEDLDCMARKGSFAKNSANGF